MRWPWIPSPALDDQREEAVEARDLTRSEAREVHDVTSRVARIHAVLMHEAVVNHFTERWQQVMHPGGERP